MHLAAGQYTGVNIDSTKWLTIVGPNAGILGTSARLPEAVVNGNKVGINASGTTLRGLKFVIPAVDDANAFVIGANNVIVEDSVFEGPGKPINNTWGNVSGSALTVFGKVYRGMVISGGLTNIVIKDNLFNGLRQPAYINDGATGNIDGNRAAGSRGWVSANSLMTFTANTFENTEASDIALLNVVVGNANTPKYCAITKVSIQVANPGAVVDDQRDFSLCN